MKRNNKSKATGQNHENSAPRADQGHEEQASARSWLFDRTAALMEWKRVADVNSQLGQVSRGWRHT